MNVTAVSAEPPGTGSIELETAVTGTVEPSDVVYLYARAAGDVTSVLVKAGDTVEAGQLLAVIDTKQVEAAENAMESARLSYESAQSTLSRQELLYAGGDISDQEYEQYQNQPSLRAFPMSLPKCPTKTRWSTAILRRLFQG